MATETYDIDMMIEEQDRYEDSRNGHVFALKPSLRQALEEAIARAPYHDRLAPAGKLLVRTIHGVPLLYEGVQRGDLEFYIGRAGATADHSFDRFRYRREQKQHRGAAVVCRCSTDVATLWEGAAVRLIKQLHDRGRLCVANIAAHGGGGLPQTSQCVIYLTWRVRSSKTVNVSTPTLRDVEEIADDVAHAMNGSVSADTLRRAMDPITKPRTEVEPLEWARRHDRGRP